MRRLHLQRHKDKARDTEVFGKIGKGILTQLKGLRIDFEQKSVWYNIIKFTDEGIYQEQYDFHIKVNKRTIAFPAPIAPPPKIIPIL